MNCKPGDLAIVVRSVVPEAVGRLVTVVCPSHVPDMDWVVVEVGERLKAAMDSRTGQLRNRNYAADLSCKDSSLRPIRDNPGEDETLSWKEVPLPSIQQREGQGA